MPLDARAARLCLALALLAWSWAVFASAWLCDDAWITLRSVDHLLGGHGLRWNVAERVQTFTHPAWALLLALAVGLSGEAYYTTLAVSLLASGAAVAVLATRVARTPLHAATCVVALASSKAFVDYSTSGLENPLTHLLLAGFFAVWFSETERSAERRLAWLVLLAALLGTNRLDTLLLVVPCIAAEALPLRRRAFAPILLGALPLVAWECFALVYYGFPFPNTAYAKLGTGVDGAALAAQGLRYLIDACIHDPVTPFTIALGCSVVALRQPRSLPAVIGVALYLVYVVRIGGDFMSGRFLAAPLFCAVMLLGRTVIPGSTATARTLAGVAAGLLVAGLLGARPTLTSGKDYGVDGPPDAGAHGIVDERAGYYPWLGLRRVMNGDTHPREHAWSRAGRADAETPGRVLLAGPVGLYAYHAGSGKHVVDEFALADPLRARLPVPPGLDWRIGHFPRAMPRGYRETLETGENRIADPELARVWDDLAQITRGPLFSAARWRAILRRNL